MFLSRDSQRGLEQTHSAKPAAHDAQGSSHLCHLGVDVTGTCHCAQILYLIPDPGIKLGSSSSPYCSTLVY